MRAWENPLHLEGYTLGEEIGRGASGTVYSAKSIETGRTYAAKKLAIEDTSIREVGVLTHLKKHPNIMEFTESKLGRDGETQVLFVITEFCPLGNIGDYILKQQVDVFTKRNLAVQMADAITFLHKNGIVHRDIKPQNVLLAGNEAHLVLKVVDFGLAKVLTSSENSVNNISRSYMRSAVGTRFYLSPEIYQSLPNDQPCRYTPSVDIFSIGLLLWAMFDGLSIPGSCGEDRYLTPFTGSETDPMPVAQAITQGDVELDVMEREENVRCKSLVRRMLSRDPKERPKAQEVLQTLIRGYGDYRLSQGVVCVVVDEDSHPVSSTISCTGTDSSCPSCSCCNLNCPKFWKGNDDDVQPGCSSFSCTRTDPNCLPCSCTGTNPSCAPCLTCCTGILRCIGCALCYLDKSQDCSEYWNGKGTFFILLSILISVTMFAVLIPYFFVFVICILIFSVMFVCITVPCQDMGNCQDADAVLERFVEGMVSIGTPCMAWWEITPVGMYAAHPSLCPCLSPQSGCCRYNIEDVPECCTPLMV